jgi:hypothetical protein
MHDFCEGGCLISNTWSWQQLAAEQPRLEQLMWPPKEAAL